MYVVQGSKIQFKKRPVWWVLLGFLRQIFSKWMAIAESYTNMADKTCWL